nr:MAG TPA: hypothetical protein [Caudoviricetes sp.]
MRPFRFETPDFHSRVIFWYHGVHTVRLTPTKGGRHDYQESTLQR